MSATEATAAQIQHQASPAVAGPAHPAKWMATRSDAAPESDAEPVTRRRKRVHPTTDLDASIEKARKAVQDAQKAMRDARATAKNDRRRRARLIKKAATLLAKDLDRIAVLKRCGM